MRLLNHSLMWGGYAVLCFMIVTIVGIIRMKFIPSIRLRKIIGMRSIWTAALLLFMAIVAMLILLRTMYSEFITIDVSKKVIKLGYFWPRDEMALPVDESLEIKVVPSGNGRRVRIEIKSSARTAVSTAMPRTVGDITSEDLKRQIAAARKFQ